MVETNGPGGCFLLARSSGPHNGSLTAERVERRLAAVLAADVAGYSRLMGIDEEGTLARLKAVRKALVDPAIASHRGRIVKTTGDGMLVGGRTYSRLSCCRSDPGAGASGDGDCHSCGPTGRRGRSD
jgi:class 3 adenylate cyclase